MRLLLLATKYALPYRVLRCAAAAGATVHVLGEAGPGRSRRLAWSRFCASFHELPADAFASAGAADRVDALARELAIDVVVPGDGATTRFLAAHASRIVARCFPVPSIATFDRLAAKDRFAALCAELGVPHPATRVVADAGALHDAIARGEVALPVMAKPIGRSGGSGVLRVDADGAPSALAALDYQPVLVQDFVTGGDVSVSMLCDDGAVLALAAYRYGGETFEFIDDPRVDGLARRVVEATRYRGVVGFDVRLGAAGEAWLIECNPRFTYHVQVTMLAGLNLLQLGLPLARGDGAGPGAPPLAGVPPVVARRVAPQRLRHAKLRKPWSWWSDDRRYLRYILGDDLRIHLLVGLRDLVRAKLGAPLGRLLRRARPGPRPAA